MYCSLHRKNRSIQFLEPIMGTDQYRCLAGNECQMGASSNSQSQFSAMGSGNFTSPQFDQHNQSLPDSSHGGASDKFFCSEHNKLRGSSFLDQFLQNDGTVGYKCKAGEECKTMSEGGPRRPTETVTHRYSPYHPQSSSRVTSQQQPPFKPGMRPPGFQSQSSYDPYASQQNHWPTNHHDPYGQSYRPPYNTYPPHFYANTNTNTNTNYNSASTGSSQQSSGDSRQRYMCSTHGKLRTVQNLIEISTGKWECTSSDPCKQNSVVTTVNDQGL